MSQKHHVMHGRDHVCGGADPIPGICLLSGNSGFPDYETGVRSISNLVGYWRLGEGASPYLDTSGYAPSDPADAVLLTGTTAMTQNYTPGALTVADDGAVQFNAAGSAVTPVSGDQLETQFTTDLTRFDGTGTSAFTVSCWVRPLASATVWTGAIVSTVQVSGGNDNGWRLEMTWPSRVVAFTRAANVAPAGSYPSAVSPAGLAANTWHHVTGTYDGTTLRLYLNGVLVASQASSGSIGNATAPTFGIGTYDHGSYGSWYYGGLDEVAIWNRELTADEISSLYDAAAGDTAADGKVLTSTGGGDPVYAYPTIAVDAPDGRYNRIHLGTNLTGTDEGDGSITIDAAGSDPTTATTWWFPLADSDGTLVLDASGSIIPTLIPL